LTLSSFLVSSAALAVTIVVTSAADAVTGCASTGTGECTLRDAITFSNANPSPPNSSNLIQFNIPGSGVQTINLLSPLPSINTATIIDGYSQPGASPNTLAVGDDAVLLIWVLGSPDTLHNFSVLTITGGTGSVIQGLVIGCGSGDLDRGFPEGIFMFSCCNRIAGNFLGVDPTGTSSVGGGVVAFSNSNLIGGVAPADRNVICHTALERDIDIHGDRNAVEGNFIGTDASGTVALSGASDGIDIDGSFNRIGGSAARGNLISGHILDGVLISSGTGNTVSGNLIGTDASGVAPLGNDNGVTIYDGSQNVVGSSLSPPDPLFLSGNRIAFNRENGVLIGGFGATPLQNSILSNSIFSNGQLGINLTAVDIDFSHPNGDGVTLNDPCDIDTGPNNLQNYPVLASATVLKPNKPRSKAETDIQGTLNSAPNTTYRIQLFASSSCDPSGYGEGETFLTDVFVTTDDSCNASFSASVPVADAPRGYFITATATDPAGNTSEFSACEPVVALHIPSRIRFLVEGPIRVAPGVPVQFQFKVEPRERGLSGDLSGQVVVSDDQGDVCQADVSPSGEGACPLTFGTPGNYRVRAHYLGNETFEESTSPPVPVLVEMPGGAP
jgi:CSLREA domain-containing protein